MILLIFLKATQQKEGLAEVVKQVRRMPYIRADGSNLDEVQKWGEKIGELFKAGYEDGLIIDSLQRSDPQVVKTLSQIPDARVVFEKIRSELHKKSARKSRDLIERHPDKQLSPQALIDYNTAYYIYLGKVITPSMPNFK